MIQKTKDIGIRVLLAAIWLSQLPLHTYHVLTTHADGVNDVTLFSDLGNISEDGSACDFCTHFIIKTVDFSFFTIAFFILTPFFFVPFFKENNLPFLTVHENFQRGPPQ